MRTIPLLLAACLGPALAADADFNGRWNISYPGSQNRASWMEVQGAGTAKTAVKFVSIYAGDLNIADEVTIRGGELTAAFRFKERRQRGEEPVAVLVLCKARLDGGRLAGTTQTEGASRPPTAWVGVRAPEIRDKDDGTWREGKPVRLFNGTDLAGWVSVGGGPPPAGWRVEDGLLRATGSSPNLMTSEKFWNFKLHVEYRTPKGSNSGIGLRGRYEIQVIDDYGQPPNSHSNGSLYSRIAPAVNATRPPGEWQTYDITLIGRDLTVVLNGQKLIDKQVVEGLTAMGHDPNEGEPGPISLQGDHGPVDFRSIVLTPLAR